MYQCVCIRYYFLISLIISIAWCNLECNYTVTWISYLVSMYETVSITVIQLLTFCTARVSYYPVLLCDSEFENHNVNVCDVPQHYFTPVMKAMATNCTDYWDATAAWRVKYRDHPWEIDTDPGVIVTGLCGAIEEKSVAIESWHWKGERCELHREWPLGI